jgi:hypothetical protein
VSPNTDARRRPVAVMLAGNGSDYITGAGILVDGGTTPYTEYFTGG